MSRIQLPARLESLREFLSFTSECAVKKGFTAGRMGQIELVIEEALVNIFNNSFGKDQEGAVEVSCPEDDSSSLTIEIRDKGIPFDPLSLPDPDLNLGLSERKIGGLGVFFIKNMTDSAMYRRDGDTNILTLAFKNQLALN